MKRLVSIALLASLLFSAIASANENELRRACKDAVKVYTAFEALGPLVILDTSPAEYLAAGYCRGVMVERFGEYRWYDYAKSYAHEPPSY